MRIGIGYDVHALVPERPLILGGVVIPYDRGLLGHSDADVLAHSIMDAMLGACALGDIGGHFPETDAVYRGARSLGLLAQVTEILRTAGYRVLNIDSTIVAQKPRLAGYITEMRSNIACAVQVDLSQVSVKATTSEHLGFEGRGEGMSAQAVVLVASI